LTRSQCFTRLGAFASRYSLCGVSIGRYMICPINENTQASVCKSTFDQSLCCSNEHFQSNSEIGMKMKLFCSHSRSHFHTISLLLSGNSQFRV
jgi:hypothetical protein